MADSTQESPVKSHEITETAHLTRSTTMEWNAHRAGIANKSTEYRFCAAVRTQQEVCCVGFAGSTRVLFDTENIFTFTSLVNPTRRAWVFIRHPTRAKQPTKGQQSRSAAGPSSVSMGF